MVLSLQEREHIIPFAHNINVTETATGTEEQETPSHSGSPISNLLWSSLVLVVKSRWVFAIGVKNLIKSDLHPAFLQEMGSAETASLGEHCSHCFARQKRDCLQSKRAKIQQR